MRLNIDEEANHHLGERDGGHEAVTEGAETPVEGEGRRAKNLTKEGVGLVNGCLVVSVVAGSDVGFCVVHVALYQGD